MTDIDVLYSFKTAGDVAMVIIILRNFFCIFVFFFSNKGKFFQQNKG